VIALQKWIDRTIIIVIVVRAISAIMSFPVMKLPVYAIAIMVLESALQIALTVIALKGLSYVLKILMQFEFNSRAANMKNISIGSLEKD
jgi:hypothetical protein